MDNQPESAFTGISLEATKAVYRAGKYDWSAAWIALLAALPTAFDYIAQFLAWLLSSPDAPQVPDKFRSGLHVVAFVLALFARGVLAHKSDLGTPDED